MDMLHVTYDVKVTESLSHCTLPEHVLRRQWQRWRPQTQAFRACLETP